MGAGIPTTFQIGAKTTPQAAATNYQQGASSKGTKWATNYLQSKVDPFEAASAAGQTWLNNINTAGVAGFQAGLARVNRANVAKLVSTQGPSLYSAGIANKGAANYASAAQGLIPAMQQGATNLPPRGSASDNENRAIAMIRYNRSLKGQFRSK